MAVYNIFSKRQKAIRGQMDVFSYDSISEKLRVQIIHIMYDALGTPIEFNRGEGQVRDAYTFIADTLAREMGLFQLPTGNAYQRNTCEELMQFILKEKDIECVLSAVELSFKVIDSITRDYDYLFKSNRSEIADDAIVELNQRFKENNCGYQFNEGQIIRMDSEFLHEQAVKPALVLLGDEKYSGAKQEFLNGYEHYLHGRDKEALNDALKSLESTMKVICAKRKWMHNPETDTSSKLIRACIDNSLIPQFWESHFSALKTTLEAGVPTGRNRMGGHGQGISVTTVPAQLTAYVLHQTAAAIVFLIESEKVLS